MSKVQKVQGKFAMARSTKKKVKREKQKVIENEDVLDQRRYLGEL